MQPITFDMLPDDVLLEIFCFHADKQTFRKKEIEEWIKLAHVCRRWRSVVFQSPLRLNLRLLCTPRTPLRDTLYIWPPLPLIIRDLPRVPTNGTSGANNIIAALDHNDRVIRIELCSISSSQLNYVTNSAAMQKPFPQLTVFSISPMVINRRQYFQIRSWAEPHHVCDHLLCGALHFQDYQNYFCLSLTSSILILVVFPVLGTFHPKRWPPASLR